MFFGVTQQVVWQDLGHWLPYVAARIDHNSTLISYLYCAKYVFEKDSGTSFRHIDLNLDKFVATGRGGNAVRGSVSLDDKSAEAGCAELVKRFHRHIDTWWGEISASGSRCWSYLSSIPSSYWKSPKTEKQAISTVRC